MWDEGENLHSRGKWDYLIDFAVNDEDWDFWGYERVRCFEVE
jgi:hypothetical protein